MLVELKRRRVLVQQLPCAVKKLCIAGNGCKWGAIPRKFPRPNIGDHQHIYGDRSPPLSKRSPYLCEYGGRLLAVVADQPATHGELVAHRHPLLHHHSLSKR